MAKLIRHDFCAIQNALNKLIIAEVKAALKLLPGKRIIWDGKTPLCHVILSPNDAYIPRDIIVTGVSISQEIDNLLCISGFNSEDSTCFAINWFEDETDWLYMADLSYLIDQVAMKIEGDKSLSLINNSIQVCNFDPELELKRAIGPTS